MSPDQPLSEATIPSRLADIQKRCAELLDDDSELDELTLQDPPEGHGEDPHAIPR